MPDVTLVKLGHYVVKKDIHRPITANICIIPGHSSIKI